MIDQRVEWPATVVLCPMPQLMIKKKLLIDRQGTTRAGQYWLHPHNGGMYVQLAFPRDPTSTCPVLSLPTIGWTVCNLMGVTLILIG